MSLHQNPASIIADKLQLDQEIPPKVLQETQSALRILKLKFPNGTFGKQDNDLKRACALLEYVVREREGYKIPMHRLARAACMKERDFAKFHQMIGNFRRNSSSSIQTSRSLRKGATPTAAIGQTSSIPSLAIKLGTYVQDSNGVSVRATKLYQDLMSHAKNLPASERGHQLRDIKDHQKAYEAACFYIAATNENTTNNRPTRMHDEDDDNKQLEISNVTDVSNEFTLAEFKNILQHTQTICMAVEDRNDTKETSQKKTNKKRQKEEESSRKRPNDTTSRISSSKRTKSTGLLSEELASNATLDLLYKADDTHHESTEVFQYEEARNKLQQQMFAGWKHSTITLAIDKMKTKMKTDKGSDQKISNEQALDLAVEEVFKKELRQ
jgi:hypothetical protein